MGADLGSFRLLRLLAAGAQGAVYEAITPIGCRVAAKVMHPENLGSIAARVRFLREPQIANAVAEVHDGAVPILFYGEAPDGPPFFRAPFQVMPLLSGRSLDERLARGPLSWGAAAALGIQLADVLAAAHDVGVVHRDVKPSNAYLSRNRRIKLLDFGIGKAPTLPGGSLTADGAVLGTIDFMAPEAAQGRAASDRADVFSLAATVVTAVTGRPLRGDGTTLEILARAAAQPVLRVAAIAPSIPAPIAEVLDAALAFEPLDRPSARTFQRALAAASRKVRTVAAARAC